MPSPGTLSPHHTLSPQVDSKTGFLYFPWPLSPKPPSTPPLQKIKDTIKENIPLCRGTRFKAKAKEIHRFLSDLKIGSKPILSKPYK
jgi:hypothetical protein